MAKWNLYGTERRDQFNIELEPKNLKTEMMMYQKYFGTSFGIADILKLMDIKAKAMIAEAINDAPEFLVDQIGKALDEEGLHFGDSIEALGDIAEAVRQIEDALPNRD